jgi:DNA-binding CsgD family transcriptional regulator
MATGTPCGPSTTVRDVGEDHLPARWHGAVEVHRVQAEAWALEPLAVPTVAEAAESVIDALDAPMAAAPVLLESRASAASDRGGAPPGGGVRAEPDPVDAAVRRPRQRVRPRPDASDREISTTPLDDYAKAVLYNGLSHYRAACSAAERACADEQFILRDGALLELVEASVRSELSQGAAEAAQILDDRARQSGHGWMTGIAACARAMVVAEAHVEAEYRRAIDHLGVAGAWIAVARARLLYGEWLRRHDRRVDAREQLRAALPLFHHVGLSGFAERATRELRATVPSARRRTDETRFELTDQEALIARLAAGGWSNAEIGERLFISPRTVEWHLRKVFGKLGVSSRRELRDRFHPVPIAGSLT